MKHKIKTLITVIPPSAAVLKVLSEIENLVEIIFPGEKESLRDFIEDAEILYGNIDEETLSRAKKLKWVQTNSTGVEQMMYPAFRNSDIILTNTGRSITTVVADHAVTLFLSLARNIHHQRDLMKVHKWEIVTGRDIGAMTLGIIGFGKIGMEIAVRSRAFVNRLHVLDVKKIRRNRLIDKTYTIDQLEDFLQECDSVICSLPLTPLSVNLISEGEFACMKPGSFLINISRGEIVNQNSLLNAIRSGRLAGAAIDVLESEPCPPESPLWDEPNLIITPHSAGYCETLEQRKMQQFVENFKHYYTTGKIPLSLDKKQGW